MAGLECAFAAAAQDGGVAGLEAERAGVAGHVGPALVDDADDAERHPHALDAQAVRSVHSARHGADRDPAAPRSPRRRAPWPRRACHRARDGRVAPRRGPWRAPRPMSRSLAASTCDCCARSRRGHRVQRAFFAVAAERGEHAARAAASRPSASMMRMRGRALRGRGQVQNQVVAMDHFVAPAKTENGVSSSWLRSTADATRVVARCRRSSPRATRRRSGPRTDDRSPRSKRPSTLRDAGGQQALAAAQRRRRAASTCSAPAGLSSAGDPLLAHGARRGLRRRTRCNARLGRCGAPGAARGRRRCTCASRRERDLRRGDLGRHAAGAHGGRRAARHGLDLGRDARDLGDERRGACPGSGRRCTGRRRPRAAAGSPRSSSARRAPRAGRCRRSGSRRSRPCRSR